jgi:class 3 adenylate cyclase
MRDLDPEEARAVIDPVLRLMIEAVHRYSGYVAQSTGDGIFAMFGAPVAHEAGQKTPFSTQPGPLSTHAARRRLAKQTRRPPPSLRQPTLLR